MVHFHMFYLMPGSHLHAKLSHKKGENFHKMEWDVATLWQLQCLYMAIMVPTWLLRDLCGAMWCDCFITRHCFITTSILQCPSIQHPRQEFDYEWWKNEFRELSDIRHGGWKYLCESTDAHTKHAQAGGGMLPGRFRNDSSDSLYSDII